MKEKNMTGYPSIDKPWLKYYDTEFNENDIPKKSIYQYALDSNINNMNNIALDVRTSANDFSRGIKISYKTFFDRIRKIAKASNELGIQKDDIVPIILPNIPEARIMLYSNNILGATSYPISPLLPVNQLEQIINENNIKNLVIFSMFYEKYAEALRKTKLENIILLDGSESLPTSIQVLKRMKETLTKQKSSILDNDNRIIPWYEFQKLDRFLSKDITPFYEDNHVAAIIGTSGTTGLPKGVCLTDKNINSVACAYKNAKIFEGSFLDALLPSIGYGISLLHYETVGGHYVYLMPELLSDRFAEALVKLKPNNFPGGPIHYLNLVRSREFNEGILPHFDNLISGGASLPREVEQKLNGVNEGYEERPGDYILVRQGYGLSESNAMGTYSYHGAYKQGSIGIPLPYLTISIFRPGTDEELSYNEPGEICLTGPNVMKEYLNNEEETSKVIMRHKDGKDWVHTKDIGYMDEQGHIFHVDRIKNIFMRKGFNVHPSKISEFINTIDGVRNNVVIGFNHPEEQCVPVAFIELEENIEKSDFLEQNILKACYNNLEETSVPVACVFVDTLPINVGGKIDIRKIQETSEIDFQKDNKVLKKELKFN